MSEEIAKRKALENELSQLRAKKAKILSIMKADLGAENVREIEQGFESVEEHLTNQLKTFEEC